jgi:hypothetical protein
MPLVCIEQTETAMKEGKKIIGLIGMFLLSAFFVNAQSSNPNWIVSKDVQRIVNQDRFAKEVLRGSYFQAKSVDFPSTVISKRVIRKEAIATKGNIESKGTNDWVISKGVHRYHKK